MTINFQAAELAPALASRPSACFLGNPANPTGTLLPAAELRDLIEAHPATWFVVDEALADFAPAGVSVLNDGPPPDNAIVVRSLSNGLGLPGLRMGYLVARLELAKTLTGILPPWPLSGPALAAAVAGLPDLEHISKGAALARREVESVSAALSAAGARPTHSEVNFLLARAPGWVAALGERGIAVKDCAGNGLHGYIRLGAPRRQDFDAVLAAINELGPGTAEA